MVSIATILCLFLSLQLSHQSSQLPTTEDVSLILVGFRHGYRNPAQFFKNDTTRSRYDWGWEGESQLTNIGKRQAYGLGKFLRSRYANLLPADWIPAQVKSTSSSAERCQMTLQSVMAGAFPPVGRAVWNPDLLWQPFPYNIDDPLLRMYNVKCPTYTKVYQPISDDNIPQSKEWLSRDQDVIKYIVENTGLNGSLSDMADVADNVQSMLYNNVSMPDWIERPNLKGYSKQRLIKEMLEFAEAHQIQCAFDKPCAQAMAGLWLNQTLSLLQQKKDGKLADRKAHFYGAHTETVLSLMRLMKMNISETPTSAGIILEFRSDPPAVRTLFHEPFPWNPDIRLAHLVELPYCAGQNWCPFETFVSNVKETAFADWQEYCGLPKCNA
jgi:hypothetical protein